VIFMCGPAGSGKSTVARQYERQGMTRLSFWSRRMRDEYRQLLRPLGVVPETVYLATGRATVLARIAGRVARDGDDFAISAELAAAYFDHFEVPTAAEGPLSVIY
jgi:predicted kinase